MKMTWLYLYALSPAAAFAQSNEAALLKAQHVTQVAIYLRPRLAATERYDANGNAIASSDDDFLPEGLKHSRLQQFNADNHVLWSKSTHSSLPDTVFWRYHYTENQRLASVTDGYTGKEVQYGDYNASGQVVRKALFAPTGQLLSEERFTYNARGQEVESTLAGVGIKGRLHRTTYDAQERPVKEQLFDKGKPFFTQLTDYLPNGAKCQVTYLEPDEATGVEYRYDDLNRLVARRHFTRQQCRNVTTGLEEFGLV